jgi:hypothetical protein
MEVPEALRYFALVFRSCQVLMVARNMLEEHKDMQQTCLYDELSRLHNRASYACFNDYLVRFKNFLLEVHKGIVFVCGWGPFQFVHVYLTFGLPSTQIRTASLALAFSSLPTYPPAGERRSFIQRTFPFGVCL